MIPYSLWLAVPLSTRARIAHQFGIAKVRSTHVSNNQVVDDGYDVHTIEHVLSLEVMQGFLNSKEKDVMVLFKNLVDVMEGKVTITESTPEETENVDDESIVEPEATVPEEETPKITKVRKTRTKK